MEINTRLLTRVTLVDDDAGGRLYEGWRKHVQLSVQDDGRTLKIFIQKREPVSKE